MNVMKKENKSKPIFTAFIICVMAITVISALSAGVVNPDYMYGFQWLNSSIGINTMNVYIGGNNYTDNIVSGVGAGNVTVRVNGGANVGSEGRLNFIEGDNVSITAVDDPANNEIDITITSTASGGGVSAGTLNNSYSPYDFRMILDETNWLMINETGGIEFNDTDPYLALQGGINVTTQDASGAEVWATGDRVKPTGAILLPAQEIPIGANTLLLPNHFSLIGAGIGTVIQYTGNNGIENMWANFTYDTEIFNLMIEGDGGGATYGIYWHCSNATLPAGDYYSWWVNFDTLYIRGSNTMIHLQSVIGSNLIARITGIRGTGNIWIQRVYDATFTNIFCSTTDWLNIVTCYFGDWYIGSGNTDIGGGTQAYPCKGNIMQGIRSDNTLNSPALRVQGYFSENVLDNWQFANARVGTGDNTEDCIRFEGNCEYNTISDSLIGNYPSRANIDTWRYGVYFSANSHNNTLSGNTYTFDQIDSAIIYEVDVGSNNIENRRQTYYGGATETIGADDEYVPINGVYATTGSMTGRCTMHEYSGHWGNLQVGRTANVPAGEWQSVFLSYQNYNIIGGITDVLEVNMTAGNNWGANTSFVHIDVGAYPDLFAYNIVSKDATCTGVTHMIIEFLPDLEEWYRNP